MPLPRTSSHDDNKIMEKEDNNEDERLVLLEREEKGDHQPRSENEEGTRLTSGVLLENDETSTNRINYCNHDNTTSNIGGSSQHNNKKLLSSTTVSSTKLPSPPIDALKNIPTTNNESNTGSNDNRGHDNGHGDLTLFAEPLSSQQEEAGHSSTLIQGQRNRQSTSPSRQGFVERRQSADHSTITVSRMSAGGTTTMSDDIPPPPVVIKAMSRCCEECHHLFRYLNAKRNYWIDFYVRRNVLLEDEQNNETSTSSSNISKRWNEFTFRNRWWIIGVWLCLIWPVGLICYPRFTQSTSSEFKPLPHSPSSDADLIYKSSYNVPSTVRLPVIVLLEQIIDTSDDNDTRRTNNDIMLQDEWRNQKWDELDFLFPSPFLDHNSSIIYNNHYNATTSSPYQNRNNKNKDAYLIQEAMTANDPTMMAWLLRQQEHNKVEAQVSAFNDNDDNHSDIPLISLIDGHSQLYNSTRDFVLCLTEHLEELIYRYGPNPSASFLAERSTSYQVDERYRNVSSSGSSSAQILKRTNTSMEERQLLRFSDESTKEDHPSASSSTPAYIKVQSYYETERRGLISLAKHAFASKSGQVTYIKIDFATPTVQDMRHFLADLTTYATTHVPSGVNVSFTGIHFFQDDILEGAKTDVKHMDSIVLPLALIVLAIVLGNIPIMMIPLLTIISATLLSAIIMYPIAACLMQVTQFTQSLMSSLVISMSIDYSLFLLARCIEEMNRQQQQQQRGGGGGVGTTAQNDQEEPSEEERFIRMKQYAICSMLEYSGHTIIASGITLCCCFLGLLFLPLAMLRSVGVGSSVAILSSLFVNLTLVPAILHTCIGSHMLRRPQNVFVRYLCCYCCGCSGDDTTVLDECNSRKRSVCCRRRRRSHYNDHHSIIGGEVFDDDDETGLSQALIRCHEEEGNNGTNDIEYVELLSTTTNSFPMGGDGHVLQLKHNDQLDVRRMKRSKWYKLGQILVDTQKSLCILIVLLVIVIPVSMYYPQCGSSISFDPMVPSDSTSYLTYEKLGSVFGNGALFPFRIIFDGRSTKSNADTASAFEVIQTTIRQLQTLVPTQHLTSFTSIASLGGYIIPHWFYEASILCGPNCWLEPMRTIASLSKEQFNAPHNMTTYIEVILNIDPNSHNGTQWLLQARQILWEIQTNTTLNPNQFDIYLEGGSSIEYDAVKAVFDHVPFMILITLSVVFVLMGLFFKSLIVPIRSILTISMTQAFVFGLSVLVYQYGLLEFVGWKSIGYAQEISWLPPVLSFCVMVGLGLDYDVFLSSRVLEYRLKGLTDQSSILVGLYKTGRIITAAGIIMAIAFGGLLGSTSLILNETSFLLTTAVLMDTFVTRTIVMPILMNLCGRLNWYPRPLPPIKYDVTI